MRAFRLAYDGRGYRGFQRQPAVETVEDELFDALRALGVLEANAAKPERYAAASRTDAGVSALQQTVAFECPSWCRPRALNAELPMSIRAWASAAVPADFHATHDPTAREYTYHLHAPGADPGVARTVLDALSGTHDFHNLTLDETGTTRTLETAFATDGAFIEIRLRAGGFSRQLVRRVVSLVRDVAAGELPLSRVERVLSAESLSGPAGIGPAPAAPLVLIRVDYPDVTFDVDQEAASSAREVFTTRRANYATRSRVAGTVADGVGSPDGRRG